jgi:hypothetical protein
MEKYTLHRVSRIAEREPLSRWLVRLIVPAKLIHYSPEEGPWGEFSGYSLFLMTTWRAGFPDQWVELGYSSLIVWPINEGQMLIETYLSKKEILWAEKTRGVTVEVFLNSSLVL